jgi:hypothetical protein
VVASLVPRDEIGNVVILNGEAGRAVLDATVFGDCTCKVWCYSAIPPREQPL